MTRTIFDCYQVFKLFSPRVADRKQSREKVKAQSFLADEQNMTRKAGRLEAIERLLNGTLSEWNGFVRIPSCLFYEAVDINPPAIPDVSLYVPEDFRVRKIRDKSQTFALSTLAHFPDVLIEASEQPIVEVFAAGFLTGAYPLAGYRDPERRMAVLQRAISRNVGQLLENPSPERLAKGARYCGFLINALAKSPEAHGLISHLSRHDPYTVQHSIGTAINSVLLGIKFKMNQSEMKELALGGLLHDIGKVMVRSSIVQKPGPLDSWEWAEMQQHSEKGFGLISNSRQISDRTKLIVLEHHEDRMGTGYPKRKRPHETDFFSRVVSICDILNALTTDRTYSRALSTFEAFLYMKEKLGFKLDEAIVNELIIIYGGEFQDAA